MKVTVNIAETSKKFEIRVDGNVVASGHAYIPTNASKEQIPENMLKSDEFSDSEVMSAAHIYKNLSVRQYQYNDTFKQLESSNEKSMLMKVP